MTINIPATVGMPVEDIDTPCLLVELDAFERNVAKLAKFIKDIRPLPPHFSHRAG